MELRALLALHQATIDRTQGAARGVAEQLAEFGRLDQLVNACPHRGCHTGCGNAECRAGRGDQGLGRTIASLAWCRLCVQTTPGAEG
jgi:hypothetical protein